MENHVTGIAVPYAFRQNTEFYSEFICFNCNLSDREFLNLCRIKIERNFLNRGKHLNFEIRFWIIVHYVLCGTFCTTFWRTGCLFFNDSPDTHSWGSCYNNELLLDALTKYCCSVALSCWSACVLAWYNLTNSKMMSVRCYAGKFYFSLSKFSKFVQTWHK